MSRRFLGVIGPVLAAAAGSACAASEPGTGGETHWIQCATDADCDAGTVCRDRVCAPPGDHSPAPSPVPRAADYASIDAGAAPAEAVDLSPPGVIIVGFSQDLLGTWVPPSGSGAPFSAGTELHFEMQAGEVTGYVVWTGGPQSVPSSFGDPLAWLAEGPFAPPSDPDVGYPQEVVVADYAGLRTKLVRGVRYRILDGKMDGERLSFWTSPVDVWQNWCALQTPEAIEVYGKRKHQCVPEGATISDTDLGKLVLCRDYRDGPLCPLASGQLEFCACIDSETGQTNRGNPLCQPAFCECSSQRCDAAVRSVTITFELTVTGARLVGTVLSSSLESVEYVRGGNPQ